MEEGGGQIGCNENHFRPAAAAGCDAVLTGAVEFRAGTGGAAGTGAAATPAAECAFALSVLVGVSVCSALLGWSGDVAAALVAAPAAALFVDVNMAIRCILCTSTIACMSCWFFVRQMKVLLPTMTHQEIK